MLLFISLIKFSPKYGLPIIEVVFPISCGKNDGSCLATDGRHLGSGLVTRQSRKK
jgi:hypothetical protein